MQLTQEQIKFLNKVVERGNWTLNSNSGVYVDGDVSMIDMNLTEIPVKFGKITGDFGCSQNSLTSLNGCPTTVNGIFWCNCNNLTSLEFTPSYVGGDFGCSHNNLTSLEFAPSKVGGGFYCYNNPLKDYFKNIKEEYFEHWNKLYWRWCNMIEEYPFLINIAKNYVDKETFIDLIKKYPKTKLYLK